MKKIFILFTNAILLLSTCADHFKGTFIPQPKQIENNGIAHFSATTYRLIDRMSTPPARLKMVKSELAKHCYWQEKKDGSIIIELNSLDAKNKAPEYYSLVISKDKIILSAATNQGIARAIGRLLNIVSGDSKTIDANGGVYLPALRITDYPDLAIRAAKLEMMFIPKNGKKEWIDYLKWQIRTIANLGYNTLIMEIGGRLQSKRNPEITLLPSYTHTEVRELAEYARICGLTPLPAINSIGHMRRAPQIFPVKNSKGKIFAMNLGHKDFYEVYFGYTDEICQVFDNPKYLFIGTDEFDYSRGLAELEKIIGKPVQKFYPEFVNRVSAYFQKKGITVSIYHDMLSPRKGRTELYNGAANGPDDAIENILMKLDRKVSISYWNYGPGNYSFIDTVQSKDFKDLWAWGWFNPEGLRQLAAASINKNLKFVASAWWIIPHTGGYAAAADIAWNGKNPPEHSNLFYNDAADYFFYRRIKPLCYPKMKLYPAKGGELLSENYSKKLAVFFARHTPGLVFDSKNIRCFAVNPPKELPYPWNFPQIAEEKNLNNLLFKFGNIPEYLAWQNNHLNKQRGSKELIIYTPEFGKNTKTNRYGSEITVVNEKVAALTGTMYIKRKGNNPIPVDGMVISLQGAHLNSRNNDRSSHDLLSGLEIGQKVTLHLRPKEKKTKEIITCQINDNKHSRVAIWFMVQFPFDRNLNLCSLKVKKNNGEMDHYTLSGINILRANYTKSREFICYSPLPFERRSLNIPPIIAVEWQGTGIPKELSITAMEGGTLAGLAVLGVWSF